MVAVFLICRCCVSERIPETYLFQVRKKYLDYDTRAQRKDYLLSCKDPRSRFLLTKINLFSLYVLSRAYNTYLNSYSTNKNNGWY